jgi:recombination protein RecT
MSIIPTTTSGTAMAKPGQDVFALITQMKPAFQQALGDPRMAERFARVAITEVRKNPMLGKCDAISLIGGMMQAAQLKLEFTLGFAYLIPYWSAKRNCYEAQFQIGYQGYMDLFYRHPLASELYAEIVYQNDRLRVTKGTDRSITHEPCTDRDPGPAIGYYAVARLKTGAMNFIYLSKVEMELYRDRYAKKDKFGRQGVWDSEFDGMALKTVVKRVLKLMPKSVELAAAMDVDEGVKRPVSLAEAANIDQVPTIYPIEAAEEVVQTADVPPAPAPSPAPGPVPDRDKRLKPTPPPTPQPVPEEVPLPEEPPAPKARTSRPTPAEPPKGSPMDTKRNEMIDIIRSSGMPAGEADGWLVEVKNAEMAADLYALESQLRIAIARRVAGQGPDNEQKELF